MSEIEAIEFVDDGRGKERKKITDANILLDNLMDFFIKDSQEVINYIEDNNLPPHFITPNKRIDLHPAREYLLRLPRISGEIVRLKKLMNEDGDELGDFFNRI
jgi:hypothetical protein